MEVEMPVLDLQVRLSPYNELSLKHQQRLGRLWDSIILNPYSFVPREKKGKVDLKEINCENTRMGRFAAIQIRKVCQQSTQEDIIRRQTKEKKFLAIGFGQGWDSGREDDPCTDWLENVTCAGLQTWWLDVSPKACKLAVEKTSSSWAEINKKDMIACPAAPIVTNGEIRSVLIDPSTVNLNIQEVEVFYLCRTLFALSKRGVQIALQIMGECLSDDKDGDKNKRIILINPLSHDNPHRVTKNSISLSKKMILSNLRHGAGRRLRVDYDYHSYFGRLYTAMTIQAE